MGETRVMAPSGQGEDTGALWAASRCHQQITINIKRSYGWGCEKEVIHKGGGHNDDDHPQQQLGLIQDLILIHHPSSSIS